MDQHPAEQSPLGKSSAYVSVYTPPLLFLLPASQNGRSWGWICRALAVPRGGHSGIAMSLVLVDSLGQAGVALPSFVVSRSGQAQSSEPSPSSCI